ncbi:pyruvate dehydrogenase E2 component (dihydrolipoamide acetyltransferase) [Nitrosospira sp. Nsp2]|uniref:dihydrolipoyllysine-residue acetyltransferase n=1 Tax=Nitrosospira sp. Nsp2 TaxID=136548 RepID=UPI000D318A48|nr:dihydrolipoyllysine-residue acetyltransferase [Nitrosospira sp. Nsp2]PTR15583.1 pyruvate dehydrogenase E2 component (dihydrolipoamide acetyltransferase) [Nitrosospira sp. Nsp2]
MAETKQVLIPDIGDFKDVPVIEVLVKASDAVEAEDPLVVLESDKATIEVPSPFSGVIKNISVKVGDEVSEGTLVLEMEVAPTGSAVSAEQVAPTQVSSSPQPEPQRSLTAAESSRPAPRPVAEVSNSAPALSPLRQPAGNLSSPDEAMLAKAHASPAVRRLARELGVNLGLVRGTGPKQRILKEDVQAYVKAELSRPRGGNGTELNLLPWPDVNFAKFGPVELRSLSRIKKMAGANLHRNWVMIPHVTQFDEADITELESLRKESNESTKEDGVKVTILAFLMRASVAVLKKFPEFNASLASDGENLVVKNYYHLGFAVDTPNGLVVPVIRDVDQKGVIAIAKEMADLAGLAREGKLKPVDMQGASFTISSLGGIGGTAFTPIINAPEVAILGVSRSSMKPVYHDGEFVPRLILPLSLSYDHRVIDGATAARFTTHLVEVLADMRRVLL